jgi:hypothetical protein
VEDKVIEIELPPSTRITLEMKMSRYVNQPAYG